MNHYRIDPETHKAWRKYPLRLPGPKCARCDEPTFLFQKSAGGFVKGKCPECGEEQNLSDFMGLRLWVACPQCQKRMEPAVLPDLNYGYKCEGCKLFVWLADLLPAGN